MKIKKLAYTYIVFVFILAGIPLAMMADIADNGIYLRMVDDADNAISHGEYAKAEQLLIEAMQLQPDDPRNVLLLSNLGMVRFYMGEDTLAINTLNDALSRAPQSVTVLLNRARVYSGLGDVDNAMKDYNAVCNLDSTVAKAFFYRGMIEMGRGHKDLAKKDFEQLAKLEPDSYSTSLALASLAVEENRPADAIPHFTRLLEVEKAPEYFGARALCYILTDKLAEASQDIAEGLAIDPNDGQLYLFRAMLNKKRYLPEDAKADVQRALQLGVSSRKIQLLMPSK